MNQKEIMRIALEQSAADMNCRAEDFLHPAPVLTPFSLNPQSRKYISSELTCNLVTYGHNIVATSIGPVKDIVDAYIHRYEYYRCFETPALLWLDERLKERGHRVCFMAEYYLPDPERIPSLHCDYALRVLVQHDFADLYLPAWSNALCEDRKQLDVLGVGAYDHGKLVGLAACSADADLMWQIGVDVLPEYRRQGIASALTSRLAREIFSHGKVPFYCSAWSNIRSVRNAIKSGFTPAWIEVSARPAAYVEKIIVPQEDSHA